MGDDEVVVVDAQAAARRVRYSQLFLSASPGVAATILPGAPPYTTTLTLENPSSEPIAWQASVPSFDGWLTLGAAKGQQLSGETSYGQPAYATVNISPTGLANGLYLSTVTVTGTQASGTQIILMQKVQVSVASPKANVSHRPGSPSCFRK